MKKERTNPSDEAQFDPKPIKQHCHYQGLVDIPLE